MLCIALVLVILAAWSVELAERRVRQASEQALVDDVAASIERRAASDSTYLVALASLLANDPDPAPATLRDYVDQLHGISDLEGGLGVGSVERFDEAGMADLERRIAESGIAQIRGSVLAGERSWPAYYATMIAPRAKNIEPSIFELPDNAALSTGFDKLAKSSDIATTDASALSVGTEHADGAGLLVLAPVPDVSGKRPFRAAAFILIRTKDFVSAAVDAQLSHGGRITFVSRSPGSDGEMPIYDYGDKNAASSGVLEKQVSVFDQKWTLRYAPTAHPGLSPLTLVIAGGGAAFSLLLFAFVVLVQRRSVDLQALVEAQTTQERERAAFIRELNHRVKNTLANVTSIISLTRNRVDDVQVYADLLLDRVKALAASHSMLDQGQWAPTDLHRIFATQLAIHENHGDKIDIQGPTVMISPNDALTIGLAVHELTTNAARYGALSADDGSLAIRWQVTDGNWVQVDWQEGGGPAVVQPKQFGFGLTLVQRALAHELQRPIELDFDPAGFHCRFFVQLREPRSFQLRH